MCIRDSLLSEKAMQQSLVHEILWHNKRAHNIAQKLFDIEDEIKKLLQNNSLEDITILTTNENTGIEIVKHFKDKGVKVSHVYDMTGKKNIKERRNEKFKFNGGTGRLKICSYHSYKGWQTPNIILVLDLPSTKYNNGIIEVSDNEEISMEDAIFISMSRVKEKELTGEYSFICLNYIRKYDKLSIISDK